MRVEPTQPSGRFIYSLEIKRDFRRLWVVRINAAARENGLTYGQLINGLKRAGVTLDRKSLAELAVSSPAAFKTLAEQAKGAKPAARA